MTTVRMLVKRAKRKKGDICEIDARVAKGMIQMRECEPFSGPLPTPKTETPVDNLSLMKIPALRAYAKENGIDLKGLRKTAEILAKIKAA